MLKQCLVVMHCALILLGGLACRSAQQPINPPAAPASSQKVTSTGVVKAAGSNIDISPGNSSNATVTLAITPGYHINANPPTFSYLKATELTVESSPGITADKPIYPPAVTKKLSFEEKPLAVYEGTVKVALPLRISPGAPQGLQKLPVKVNVQACDDQACYPPGTIEAIIPVTIK